MTAKPTRKREIVVVAGLILCALILRALYLSQIGDNPFFNDPVVDSQTYVEQAGQIVDESFIGKTAFWQPPLYPYFLALVYAVSGDFFCLPRFIQIVLGAFSCVLIYWIGRKAFNRTVGLVAAAAAGIYGPFIYFEGELLPVTIATFLDLVLILLLLTKPHNLKWGAAAGVVLGLAALTVANILLFAPFAVAWVWFAQRRKEDLDSERATARSSFPGWALGFCAGAVLVIAPVTIRNYALSRDFVLISSNAGVNFYIGNNADYDTTVNIRPGPEWEKLTTWPDEQWLTKPSERSGFFFKKAWAYISEHPLDYLLLMGRKVFLFWRGDEIKRNQDAYFLRAYSPLLSVLLWKIPHLAIPFGIIGPLALLGLVLSLKRWRQLLLLYFFTVVYFVSILLFFVTGRYRIPLVPLLLIFSAYTVVWIIKKQKERQPKALLTVVAIAVGLFLILNAGLDLSQPLEDPELQFTLGTVYLKKKMYDEAEAAYLEAYRLDQGNTRALYNLAVMHTMRNRHDQAVGVYERALKNDPENPELHYNLALALDRMERTEEAKKAYQNAIEWFEKFLRDREDAQLHADRAVYLKLGTAYLELGRLDEALATYNKLFATPTLGAEETSRMELAEAANNMGFIYTRQNKLDQAVKQYQRALEYLPDNPEILYNIASIYEGQGLDQEAIETYRKILRIQPDHEKARQALERLNP